MPTCKSFATLSVTIALAISFYRPAGAEQSSNSMEKTQHAVDPNLFSSRATPSTALATMATAQQLDALFDYIKTGWITLRRSNHDLLKAAEDPKHPSVDSKWPVYISEHENIKAVQKTLTTQLPLQQLNKLQLKVLHAHEQPDLAGVLFLPNPYVVPGGRFNEMYGWDSYFILRGLLRDQQIELAKQMTDNLLYEIKHYGTILNANRTYYLTRSQPPLLTGMILAVFEISKDKAWLKTTLEPLEKYYQFWQDKPHATPTGLARYFDSGHGPAPEVLASEIDKNGQDAYSRIKQFYKTHTTNAYSIERFYNRREDKLTENFYVGDRSMRESGFDPSARFGPFNADITDYNPVCLNTLLYIMEEDMAKIYARLGHKTKMRNFQKKATARAKKVNAYTWDAEKGLYFDYNFESHKKRDYPFLTTFYPLWAGIASASQAAAIVSNLDQFEVPGGLLTSTNTSGAQWDAPYGWAPLHLIAVEGLRRYGYHDEANRISLNFLSLILSHHIIDGSIFEKYDVAHRYLNDISSGIKFGYTSNEIGFGWTNAVFTNLYDALPEDYRPFVLNLDGIGIGSDAVKRLKSCIQQRYAKQPSYKRFTDIDPQNRLCSNLIYKN